MRQTLRRQRARLLPKCQFARDFLKRVYTSVDRPWRAFQFLSNQAHLDLGSDELSQLCLFRLCPGAASRLWTCHSEKPQMKVLIQSQQARFRKGLGLAQTSTASGNWGTCGGNRGLAEAPLCRKGRYAPPAHVIKLTEAREITPYKWVLPGEER